MWRWLLVSRLTWGPCCRLSGGKAQLWRVHSIYCYLSCCCGAAVIQGRESHGILLAPSRRRLRITCEQGKESDSERAVYFKLTHIFDGLAIYCLCTWKKLRLIQMLSKNFFFFFFKVVRPQNYFKTPITTLGVLTQKGEIIPWVDMGVTMSSFPKKPSNLFSKHVL